MRSVEVNWVVVFKQKQWLSEYFFQNNKNIQTYNWTTYELCESTVSGGFQAQAMAFRRNHWNILHIQTYNWTKYALFEGTLSGGLQAEAMVFRRNFSKHYIYIFKQTIQQSMRSVKVQRVVGFKQKQWVSEEVFQNILHIQTCNWTMYALCESTLSGGILAEAMAFRRSFSKEYTHSNIKLNKRCSMWKYTVWWASTRKISFQKKFFNTLYTFKHTIEQRMRSVKVQWVVGFKQKQCLSEEVFQNIIHIQTYNWKVCDLWKYSEWWVPGTSNGFQKKSLKQFTYSNIQLNKVCAPWRYTELWASSRSNSFQKNFFETLYIFKHTIAQSMRSVEVNWVVVFKQKQWLSEYFFQNNINIQTYNWTTYELCESTLSGGLQAGAMSIRWSFSKH